MVTRTRTIQVMDIHGMRLPFHCIIFTDNVIRFPRGRGARVGVVNGRAGGGQSYIIQRCWETREATGIGIGGDTAGAHAT